MSSGVFVKVGGSEQQNQSGQQHLIIQAVEFDHKHRNWYGYMAFGAFILVLINYIMIENRACKFSIANGGNDFDLIQGFHMTALIVAIIVFILSYFNFAVVIYEFKLLFYTSALLIFVCVGILIYNVVAITYSPCVTLTNEGFLSTIDATPIITGKESTVFSATDGIGITVFFFDIVAAVLLFLAGRSFYKRN